MTRCGSFSSDTSFRTLSLVLKALRIGWAVAIRRLTDFPNGTTTAWTRRASGTAGFVGVGLSGSERTAAAVRTSAANVQRVTRMAMHLRGSENLLPSRALTLTCFWCDSHH